MTAQNELIEKLRLGLAAPLTGEISHFKMLPSERRGAIKPPETVQIPVAGSVLILLYPKNGFFSTVLIKRTEDNGVHSGQISFPGGKQDSDDISSISTALREAEEEIGVKPFNIEVIGTLSPLYVSPSNFEITPVVGFTNKLEKLAPNPAEVAYTIELPLKNINRLRTNVDILVRGTTLKQVPCFNLNGHIIWGATAMILQELLDVMENNGVRL
ncbi:MAG: CoA pyrophosphatase [Bacteroidales bacterium]